MPDISINPGAVQEHQNYFEKEDLDFLKSSNLQSEKETTVDSEFEKFKLTTKNLDTFFLELPMELTISQTHSEVEKPQRFVSFGGKTDLESTNSSVEETSASYKFPDFKFKPFTTTEVKSEITLKKHKLVKRQDLINKLNKIKSSDNQSS